MKKELMTKAELQTKIAEIREKVRVINFAGAGSRPKNVKEIGTFRKEIARLETMKTALSKNTK
jgi:ribosomal protein L29